MLFTGVNDKANNYLNKVFVHIKHNSGELDGIFYTETGDGKIRVYNEDALQCEISNKDIKNFEFLSPPLGYINLPDYAEFLVRLPSRNWKAGICRSNSRANCFRDYTPRTIIPALTKILEQDYPTFKQASEKTRLTAFSDSYAVEGRKLFFMGQYLGNHGSVSFQSRSTLAAHKNNLERIGYPYQLKYQEPVNFDGDL